MIYMLYENNDKPGLPVLAVGKSDSAGDWQSVVAKKLIGICQRNRYYELGLICVRCLTPALEDFLNDTLCHSDLARVNFVGMMWDLANKQPDDYENCMWLFTPEDFDPVDLQETFANTWDNITMPI